MKTIMEIGKPQKLTNTPWLNLFKLEWKNKKTNGEWIFASRRQEPKPGIALPEADAVAVVPIHVENHGDGKSFRRLVVTREFRMPIGDYEYSIPAGIKMPNESLVQCATRELKEETGLTLTSVKRVSPPLYSSTGLSDETVATIFAECVGKVSGEDLEASEELSVHLLSIDQIGKLCHNHTVKHSSKLWPILLMFSMLGTLEFRN